MKKGIHPEYKKAVVSCACGNKFETNSTVGDIKVEICSNCHPFFTGKQKLIDTAGRVEKYRKKYKLAEGKSGAVKAEPVKAEKMEPAKAEPEKVKVEEAKPQKTDAAKAEPQKIEPPKVEAKKPEAKKPKKITVQ